MAFNNMDRHINVLMQTQLLWASVRVERHYNEYQKKIKAKMQGQIQPLSKVGVHIRVRWGFTSEYGGGSHQTYHNIHYFSRGGVQPPPPPPPPPPLDPLVRWRAPQFWVRPWLRRREDRKHYHNMTAELNWMRKINPILETLGRCPQSFLLKLSSA